MRSFFSLNKISSSGIVILVIYSFINFLFIISYKQNENSHTYLTFLFFYSTLGQFILYIFLCSYMKNIYFFSIAIFVSIFTNLFYFFYIKDDTTLYMKKLNVANGLRNEIFILLFFQLIRYLSLLTQYQEPGVPNRSQSTLGGKREITQQDVILYISYIIFIIIFLNI